MARSLLICAVPIVTGLQSNRLLKACKSQVIFDHNDRILLAETQVFAQCPAELPKCVESQAFSEKLLDANSNTCQTEPSSMLVHEFLFSGKVL